MTEYFETDDNLDEEVFEVEEDVFFQVKENTTEAIEFITEDNKENVIKTIDYFNEDKTNEVVIDMTEFLIFDDKELSMILKLDDLMNLFLILNDKESCL